MKRSTFLPALFAAGCSLACVAQTPNAPGFGSAAAPAAPTAPAGPAKIAVIAFQAAVGQTNEFQRAFIDLQKKFEPKREALKTLSDDIDNQTKQLQTNGDKLSEDERVSRTRALDEKKKKFDREQQDDQEAFQDGMQEIYSSTASKVYDVLSDYAEKNGYTLVLDVAVQQTPIMYAMPTMDITKIVIDAYNVKSGVPAPPPQAAPAATAPPAAPAPGAKTPPAKPATPRPQP